MKPNRILTLVLAAAFAVAPVAARAPRLAGYKALLQLFKDFREYQGHCGNGFVL